MSFKISIIKFTGEGDTLAAHPQYEQTVESLNLRAVIDAVNEAPPTQRKTRRDRGQTHKRTESIL